MIALIPVKTLAHVKTRLAGTLDIPARIRLMRDTLRHTIGAIQQAGSVDAVFVVTRDPEVAAWVEDWGARTLNETREGLNESLEEARAQLQTRFPDAGALLVAPGDLGWLQPEDVRSMAALLAPGPAVVIAPDRHEQGTNALLLQPPGAIPFCFGPGSAHSHAQQAAERGVVLKWYRSSSTSLDVDEPDDLGLYHAAPYVW